MKESLLSKIKIKLRPWGMRSFLVKKARPGSRILDVGCGNESSIFLKKILNDPHCYGLDVQNYNQSEKSLLLYTDYRVVQSSEFAKEITKFGVEFDIILINHNIEHCEDPEAVFSLAISVLKTNGYIFIATPSHLTENFPKRKGTLNFYDDVTHIKPVSLMKLFNKESEGLKLIYFSESYKPIFWFCIGLLVEVFSKSMRRKLIGTWDYWGFESILWVQKK